MELKLGHRQSSLIPQSSLRLKPSKGPKQLHSCFWSSEIICRPCTWSWDLLFFFFLWILVVFEPQSEFEHLHCTVNVGTWMIHGSFEGRTSLREKYWVHTADFPDTTAHGTVKFPWLRAIPQISPKSFYLILQIWTLHACGYLSLTASWIDSTLELRGVGITLTFHALPCNSNCRVGAIVVIKAHLFVRDSAGSFWELGSLGLLVTTRSAFISLHWGEARTKTIPGLLQTASPSLQIVLDVLSQGPPLLPAWNGRSGLFSRVRSASDRLLRELQGRVIR